MMVDLKSREGCGEPYSTLMRRVSEKITYVELNLIVILNNRDVNMSEVV